MRRAKSNQELQFKSLLRWAIILPSLSVVAMTLYLYGQVRSSQDAGDAIWNSTVVIAQAHHIQQLVTDARMDKRLVAHVPEEFLALQKLVNGTPEQARALSPVLKTAQPWLSRPENEKLRFRLRSALRKFARQEEARRTQRIEYKDNLVRLNLAVGFCGVILFSGTVVVFIRRNLRRLYAFYQDALNELETALKARDEFLSIASHELNTPLTSLKLQLQMTQKGLSSQESAAPNMDRYRRSVGICLKQTQRIAGLVADLLDVSRIQSGHMRYQFETTNLSQLVQASVEREAEQLHRAGCNVYVNADPSLQAECDPFRLEQVISNLLSNAAKYGAGKPVRICVQRDGDCARISVEDSGIGIPPGKEEMIFERFGRAVHTENVSGLGLGLYISKQIVQSHGGKISVKSQQGVGTTFVVLIPLLRTEPIASSLPLASLSENRISVSSA